MNNLRNQPSHFAKYLVPNINIVGALNLVCPMLDRLEVVIGSLTKKEDREKPVIFQLKIFFTFSREYLTLHKPNTPYCKVGRASSNNPPGFFGKFNLAPFLSACM